MTRKLLAKLTTKSVNLNPIGGTPDITWQDVAFALAGLDELHHLFARAIYCADNQDTEKLIRRIARANNLEYDFVKAALFEFAYEQRCSPCLGSGEIGVKQCPKCLGSGLKSMSDNQRARLIGRSRSYYFSRQVAYDDLVLLFNHMDDQVVGHLIGKLREIAA